MPRGCAIQARVFLERVLDPRKMSIAASGGRITAFDLPSGPGVSETLLTLIILQQRHLEEC